MNDEAPSTGTPGSTPDPAAAPPPPPPADGPDKTVMRPREQAEEPARPAPAPGGHPAPGAHAAAPAETTVTPAGTPATTVTSPAAPGVVGGFASDGPRPPVGPIDPQFPTRASKAGATSAIVAVGTGLLGAAVAIAAIRSRSDGDDLDWSNYGVGLGATAVLLVVALLGALAGRRTGGRAREEVVTWPGVVGILGAAVMLNVGIDSSENWLGYLTGAVLVVLGALGYVAARRAAFVVLTILGLALIYALLYDDFVAGNVGEGSPAVTAAAVVGVFVIVVTALGWLLPSRAVTGVVVGAVAVATYGGILVSFLVARYFFGFFGSFGLAGDAEGPALGGPSGADDFGFQESDVWWVLAFAAVLTVLWALAASVSNHAGFSILAIVMPTLTVPLATIALAAEHPTRWSVAVAAAGGVLLLGGLALARLRGKSVAADVGV